MVALEVFRAVDAQNSVAMHLGELGNEYNHKHDHVVRQRYTRVHIIESERQSVNDSVVESIAFYLSDEREWV